MSYWTDFWHQHRITIQGDSSFDQLAMDFAAYHLQIMTPRNDPSVSVGAKGLTGEGYKGHVFWDTEIFILPFFLYQFPEVAKNLLLYRYDRLEGARQKQEIITIKVHFSHGKAHTLVRKRHPNLLH